jgi:hypothetical protein
MSTDAKFTLLTGSIQDLLASNQAEMDAAEPGSPEYYLALGGYSVANALQKGAERINGDSSALANVDLITEAHDRLLTHTDKMSALFMDFWRFLLERGDSRKHNAATIPALPLIHALATSGASIFPQTPEAEAMYTQGMQDIENYLNGLRMAIERNQPPSEMLQ